MARPPSETHRKPGRTGTGRWPALLVLVLLVLLVLEDWTFARDAPALRVTTPARPFILSTVPVVVTAGQGGKGAVLWRHVGRPCGRLTVTMPDMPMPPLRAPLMVASPGRCAGTVVLTMPGRWRYALLLPTGAGTQTLHRTVQARD